MELKSKNPFLSNKSFTKGTAQVYDAQGNALIDFNNTMTVKDTINKSMFLFALLVTASFVSAYLMLTTEVNPYIFTLGCGIGGFIVVLIAGFKPSYSPILAPTYATLKGLFIGGLSLILEMMYPGIVLQAISATFVTFIVCFLLYRFNVVKVTEQFKKILIAATLAVFTYIIISFFAYLLFDFTLVGRGFNDSSWMSIGISVFVIVIAALNLFLDFDMIEKGAEQRQPKYMEWFGAMGLMVTLVWLYVEFLRLFAKLSSRD